MAYLFYTIAVVSVFYPLSVWFNSSLLKFGQFNLFDLFPAFGLLAFSVMWLHVVGGAFRVYLEKYINFERFVYWSSIVVLISLILHPGLLFLALYMSGGGSPYDFVPDGKEYLITIAIVAWVIFIGYDILKFFRKRGVLIKHWEVIKLISTLALFLGFFHSIGIGRDLQTNPLRSVWIFYGITATIATVYTYFIKPFRK